MKKNLVLLFLLFSTVLISTGCERADYKHPLQR